MVTKRDLRTTAAGAADSLGEHLAQRVFAVTGLHPFDVVPTDGDTLPAPHEDQFFNDLGESGAGDSVYYLTNVAPIELGDPVMRPGRFDGQRVRLSPTTSLIDVVGASARGAPVTISPGHDVEMLWDAGRNTWVLAGTPGGGAAPVSSVFGRTGAVAAEAGDYAASEISDDSDLATTSVAAAINFLNISVGVRTLLAFEPFAKEANESTTSGTPVNYATYTVPDGTLDPLGVYMIFLSWGVTGTNPNTEVDAHYVLNGTPEKTVSIEPRVSDSSTPIAYVNPLDPALNDGQDLDIEIEYWKGGGAGEAGMDHAYIYIFKIA